MYEIITHDHQYIAKVLNIPEIPFVCSNVAKLTAFTITDLNATVPNPR